MMNPRDVLCIEQADGCVFCDSRDSETAYFDPDEAGPSYCDPKDPDECVEFCTPVAPACALPWQKGPSCLVGSELEFRRALFARETERSPEVTFVGRVVDDAGKRIESAKIRVWHAGRAAFTPIDDVESGKDGSFRVRMRTGPWVYALRISHAGRASELVDHLSAEKLDQRQTAPRVFHLPDESTLRGRVLDDASGTPVADAVIEAARNAEEGLAVSEAKTDADGNFVLGGLEARRYVLRVTKFGWIPQTVRPAAQAPGPRVTIRLVHANVIRGTAVDDTGDPISHATVVALLSGVPSAPNLPISWTTDADGKFAQDRFAAGPYYIWARRHDRLVYPPAKVEIGGSQQDVEVRLALTHKGARVSGHVQAQAGNLLADGQGRVVFIGRSPLAFPRNSVAEIEPDGTFTATGLLPGRYEISVRDGLRTLAIVQGPRAVEVPIEPDSRVPIEPVIMVRGALEE